MRLFAAALLVAFIPLTPALHGQVTTVKDGALLRPAPPARVAIYDFEDLECPACAHAFPQVHEAADHYKIPLMRHDFPLQMHIWSRDGAVTARYIQDTVSPQAAEEFRGAVFANQMSISSKDDLQAFTQQYFQKHGRTMPFVVDPTGRFSKEVQADYDLGQKIGLNHTPSIFIVTQKGYTEVTDITQLYQTIDASIASAGAPTATTTANSKMRRSTTAQR